MADSADGITVMEDVTTTIRKPQLDSASWSYDS